MPLLRLSQVNKSYDVGGHSLHVLRDLDFEVQEGELLAIMGSSGSGKSTLLHILGILDAYDSGTYEIAGTLVKDLDEAQAAGLRNRFIGFVFQSFHLIPFKNAVENVALPLYYQGVPRRQRNETALSVIERVGLGAWKDHLPNELSGGQKQRLAIARALVTTPRLILADEPTGALDSETSRQILELFEELNGQGMTIVIVTHEHQVAERTPRVIRLNDGRIESDLVKPRPVASR